MQQFPPPSHPRPIKPPRKRGRQVETANVRMWVRALNQLGVGRFWRVKNTGTFDPTKRVFRKQTGLDFVAIPDVCGHRTKPRGPRPIPVYIEGKYVHDLEKKQKLIFSVKITNDQKVFLQNAHSDGCLAGVAFTLDDCIAIVMDDPTRYVRHPRTYLFLPDDQHPAIIERYKAQRKALSQLRQDPVASVTHLARPYDEPEDDLPL